MKTTHVLFSDDFRKTPTVEFHMHHPQETIVAILTGTCEANIIAHVDIPDTTVRVIGLVIGKQNEEIKLHTLQHHATYQTTSDLLVKSVIADEASFMYDGSIKVDKDAQRTNAYQRNENLLLSSQANARSKPSLEILANDVRCTHGATVGTLQEDQVFYLASRGINREEAKHLIIEGFLNDAMSKIEDIDVQRKAREVIWQTL